MQNFNKTAIIIPSRIGSTRLTRKPLADINGKPMIMHVYERCLKADVGDVFVATDSYEISQVITSIGGNAVDTDSSLNSGTDRVFAALQKIDPNGAKYEYVINVQGDIPNISPDVIIETLKLMQNTPDADITTPICEIPQKDAIKVDMQSVVKPVVSFKNGITTSGQALYFSRSRVPFFVGGAGKHYEHVGLYVFRRASLQKFVQYPQSYLEKAESLEQLRALENSMKIYCQVVSSCPISVDIPSDLEAARKVC